MGAELQAEFQDVFPAMASGGHRGPTDTIVFGAKDNGIWRALFVNPTEYSLCREHYYGGHSEGPGGVL